MSNIILNELPELLNANIISEETAQKIKEYYIKIGMKARTNNRQHFKTQDK